jgi:hypothetical protein
MKGHNGPQPTATDTEYVFGTVMKDVVQDGVASASGDSNSLSVNTYISTLSSGSLAPVLGPQTNLGLSSHCGHSIPSDVSESKNTCMKFPGQLPDFSGSSADAKAEMLHGNDDQQLPAQARYQGAAHLDATRGIVKSGPWAGKKSFVEVSARICGPHLRTLTLLSDYPKVLKAKGETT